jgi:hypothetical protein
MRVAAIALLLMVGGCGNAGSTEGGAPEASPTTGLNPRGEPAALALKADGLSLLPVGVYQPINLDFGTSTRAEVEKAAASAFPGIMPKRTQNGECGAGPMDFTAYGTLRLAFRNGILTGWFAEAPPVIATIDGISPGITRAELERERPFEMVAGSTLPGEFRYTIPNKTVIGGFVSGPGADAAVTSLFAGETCFFR